MTNSGRLARAALLGGLVAMLCAPALPQGAPPLHPVEYAALSGSGVMRVTFDTLPRRAEPGLSFDAALRLGGLRLGERFAGQDVAAEGGFDRITGRPAAPLAVRAGAPRANLSVAYHRGFGSNALFALGPAGFPARAARGEGAVAVLYDTGQSAIGLRIHSDYPDPLGQRSAVRGHVRLILYTRAGRVIGEHRARLSLGVTDLALRRAGGRPDIAGVLIVTDDPGGIAIDDILYQIDRMLG